MALPTTRHLLLRWLLYALALLLLASALACGGKIIMQLTEDIEFFPGEFPKASKVWWWSYTTWY